MTNKKSDVAKYWAAGNRHGGTGAVGAGTGLCNRKTPPENGDDLGENFPGLGTAPKTLPSACAT